MRKQRIGKIDQVFLNAYFGEANRNASESARIAGLSHPQTSGPRVAKRLSEVIKAREDELSSKARLSAEQVVDELCKVALDIDNPAQRVRALEVLAKIHGMTNDKINVTVDRKLVSADLDKALAALDLLTKDSSSIPKLLPVKEMSEPS